MKASFFEPIRYAPPQKMPAQWPLPPGFMILRWVCRPSRVPSNGCSLSRNSVRLGELFRAPLWCQDSHPIAHCDGGHMAAYLHNMKIAVLGPIISLNNPVRVAKEFAMLDTLTQGRLVVGLLRGTTNEYLVYDVKPEEARAKTTEGMELILKAWTSLIRSSGKAAISSTATSRSGHAPAAAVFAHLLAGDEP